jgi:hypothetical protein
MTIRARAFSLEALVGHHGESVSPCRNETGSIILQTNMMKRNVAFGTKQGVLAMFSCFLPFFVQESWDVMDPETNVGIGIELEMRPGMDTLKRTASEFELAVCCSSWRSTDAKLLDEERQNWKGLDDNVELMYAQVSRGLMQNGLLIRITCCTLLS